VIDLRYQELLVLICTGRCSDPFLSRSVPRVKEELAQVEAPYVLRRVVQVDVNSRRNNRDIGWAGNDSNQGREFVNGYTIERLGRDVKGRAAYAQIIRRQRRGVQRRVPDDDGLGNGFGSEYDTHFSIGRADLAPNTGFDDRFYRSRRGMVLCDEG
jgi:hypothetical protein